MSYIVTGGAGFIGSNVVQALNEKGIDDIVVVDNIASSGKWQNLIGKKFKTYIHKEAFLGSLSSNDEIDAVIHMGACSSTTEKDFDYLWNNNYEYTKWLWGYCADNGIPFIYASSAATYGDGINGFDDETDIDLFKPLNGYGYSKHLFDLWVEHQAVTFPPQYVGLKFFNVYGPGESHKGNMASMVFHGYHQVMESGEIRLFKSDNPQFPDGGQKRDFIYVKDICKVIMWLLEHGEVSGLFNVGTGQAASFEQLAVSVFKAMNKEVNIRYIDMPENLKGKYQYYTQATMQKLRKAGYTSPFMDIESGADDYVNKYLSSVEGVRR